METKQVFNSIFKKPLKGIVLLYLLQGESEKGRVTKRNYNRIIGNHFAC